MKYKTLNLQVPVAIHHLINMFLKKHRESWLPSLGMKLNIIKLFHMLIKTLDLCLTCHKLKVSTLQEVPKKSHSAKIYLQIQLQELTKDYREHLQKSLKIFQKWLNQNQQAKSTP